MVEIRCALFSDLQTADGAAESLAEKRNLHPKVWDKQKNALYLHSEIALISAIGGTHLARGPRIGNGV